MKTTCVFIVAVLAVAIAIPLAEDKDAVVVKYDNDNIGVDKYSYAVETSNGIAQQEEGTLQNAGSENEFIQARGSFSYTGPDGVVYKVTYVADENGFQAEGDHLPKAP